MCVFGGIVSVWCTDSVRVHTDTIDARELTGKAGDSYLLDLVARQSAQIAAKEDSIAAYRILHDTTTIIPLHLGYADSIRCAVNVRKQGGTSVLCLPLLYIAPKAKHFSPLTYEAHPQPDNIMGDHTLSACDVRTEARRYLTTHAAHLYKGVAKPLDDDLVAASLQVNHPQLELEIAPRYLVKDVEEERRERLLEIKNRVNPWFKEANLLLQFTQNYVSPNWFEGGNSSFAVYASAKGTIKYDDKKRITWENYGEWTAGGNTVSGDSLRKINCSDDLFRLYSKLGVKIVPKLYGSFSVEFRTQFFPTFKANTNKLKTGPFTPIRFNIALGLDYKPVKGLSVVFSPAAFKLVHANDTVRSPYTTYGVKPGNKTLAEFGTSTRVEWMWKPLRELSLETKFYAYTNYKMIEMDLEVICDFIVNRFITTRVILHPRYDSSAVQEGEKHAKIQFKELVSIGFAHKFY